MVSQGSILRSLLSIIYVNDIGGCLEHSSVKLYAEEALFYIADSSIDMVSWALNRDKLSLHIGKPSSMLISSKPKIENPGLNLNIDETNINQVKSFKYLVIT